MSEQSFADRRSSMKITAGKGRLKAKMVVRDKEGRPKFANEKLVSRFWDVLSDEDRVYLAKKFNLEDTQA